MALQFGFGGDTDIAPSYEDFNDPQGDDEMYLPSAYLGAVGNAVAPPNAFAGGFFQSMNETRHVIHENVTALKFVWQNWYNDSTLPGEVNTGAVEQMTASVVGPNGSRVRVTFNNAITGYIPVHDIIESDWAPVTVNYGQSITLRSWTNNAGGLFFNNISGGLSSPITFTFGVTVTDLTGGGAVPGPGGGTFSKPPVAIIAMTRRGAVVLCGDSIQLGLRDGTSNSWGDIGIVAKAVGKYAGYVNLACGSETQALANIANNYRGRTKLLKYGSSAINNYGINDIVAGDSAATLAGRRTTFATSAQFEGKPVYGCGLLPTPSSTDGFITLANQTANAVRDAVRLPFNVLQMAGISGEAGSIPLPDALESDFGSGKWAVGYLPGATAGASIVFADGVHPLSLGSDRVDKFRIVPLDLFTRR